MIIIQGKQVPNLILLDLLMPRLTGVGFLTIVRGRPEFDHVPVVVCTALAETKEIRGKIGNHIHGYLIKPINREKLVVKLLAALDDIVVRVDYQS